MKTNKQFASRLISANLGSGVATYALIEGAWFSVNANFNNGEIFDIRWSASSHEVKYLQSLIQENKSAGIEFI